MDIKMKRFLFQGDSITDASRDRAWQTDLGKGYAMIMASSVTSKFPGEFEFINKGVSGDRIVDIYQRIKADILNLKPDYMSLLVGINDLWHEYCHNNGVDAVKFEKIYCMLIEEIKEALPDIKIILLEPFVLKGGPAPWGGEGTIPHWEEFKSDILIRAEIVKRIAEKYKISFVPLKEEFDKLGEKYGNHVWVIDGVHPTPAGYAVIAEKLEGEFLKIK